MSHRRELSTSNCLRSAQRLGLLETTHLTGSRGHGEPTSSTRAYRRVAAVRAKRCKRGEGRGVGRAFLARFFLSLRCLRAVVLALPIPNCATRAGTVRRRRGDCQGGSYPPVATAGPSPPANAAPQASSPHDNYDGGGAHPREAVLGLELLGSHEAVVDHTEPCAPAATEGNLEAEQQAAAGVLHLKVKGGTGC